MTERDRANPADGPMQDRRVEGVAAPELPAQNETADLSGIEIDNAIERPRQADQTG